MSVKRQVYPTRVSLDYNLRKGNYECPVDFEYTETVVPRPNQSIKCGDNSQSSITKGRCVYKPESFVLYSYPLHKDPLKERVMRNLLNK